MLMDQKRFLMKRLNISHHSEKHYGDCSINSDEYDAVDSDDPDAVDSNDPDAVDSNDPVDVQS